MTNYLLSAITASVLFLTALSWAQPTLSSPSLQPDLTTQQALDSVFEELKNNPRSYEDKGAVCEEVAKVLIQRQYPAPRYSVEVGIAYGDLTNTIGELDEVVIDHQAQKAIKVYEVKCWTDLTAGKEKALAQRTRFLKAIRSSKDLYFISTSTQDEFPQSMFEGLADFSALGQKGAVAAGYEFEMPFTMKELMTLRVKLLRCQTTGLCPKPF